MNANTRATAARAFVRSLNILLKFARMYDFGHPRTKKQYETAWSELQSALGSDNEAGVLLSVSGDQLLLDGMSLESAAAEKSFARMLSGAGIASIHADVVEFLRYKNRQVLLVLFSAIRAQDAAEEPLCSTQ
jgi:hypothetical protein